MEGVIKFTFCISDNNVMRFRNDSLVSISILYLEIKSQTLNSYRGVTLLTPVKQPCLEMDLLADYEDILIESKHKSTNVVSSVLFNMYRK